MSNSHNHIGDDLLILIKKGDEAAFATFCGKYRTLLFTRANQRLKNDDESKDVVQEIWIWIWDHRDSIDVSKGIQAYLMGAVKKKTADLIRQKIARRRKMYDYANQQYPIVQLPSSIERKELNAQINSAISALSPATRQAFTLSYMEDKSQKEIAAEMGIKVQSVKNHISRALKQLRETLEKK